MEQRDLTQSTTLPEAAASSPALPCRLGHGKCFAVCFVQLLRTGPDSQSDLFPPEGSAPCAGRDGYLGVKAGQGVKVSWEGREQRSHHVGGFSQALLVFPGKIKVEVLPPIETKGLTSDDVSELTDRCYRIMRETLFRLSGRPGEVKDSS